MVLTKLDRDRGGLQRLVSPPPMCWRGGQIDFSPNTLWKIAGKSYFLPRIVLKYPLVGIPFPLTDIGQAECHCRKQILESFPKFFCEAKDRRINPIDIEVKDLLISFSTSFIFFVLSNLVGTIKTKYWSNTKLIKFNPMQVWKDAVI